VILSMAKSPELRPLIQRLREKFGRRAFEPNSQERCVLITINSVLSGAQSTHVTGFGVPEHHGRAGRSGTCRYRTNV